MFLIKFCKPEFESDNRGKKYETLLMQVECFIRICFIFDPHVFY